MGLFVPSIGGGLTAPQIITGRGYVNLSADGYCGPGATDMLAGWNQAVADVQSAGRGQGIKITSGNWTTSRTLEAGLGTARVMIDGHEGQVTINTSTATAAFSFTGSCSGTVLTVSANASGGRIGVGTNIKPASGTAFTIMSAGSGSTWNTDISQTIASGTMTANNPIMLIGGGSALGGAIHGHLHGVRLIGASVAPNDLSRALTIASYTSFRLHHIEVGNTDIGIDAINNTFGLDLDQIWAGSGGVCNVGIHIRGGSTGGAGNQVKIDNAWSTGAKAGLQIAGDCDGVAVKAGQLGCTTDSDANGCLVVSKQYVSGVASGTGVISIDTVDFEGFKSWMIRSWDQFVMKVVTCSVVGYGGGRGIMHATNDRNSAMTFDTNAFSNGSFSSPVAILRDGTDSYAGAQYHEQGSKVDNLTFNGVSVSDQHPLVMQSGLNNATAFYNDYSKGPSVWAGGRSVPIASLAKGPAVNAASDSAAATAGVAVGELYRNGNAVLVRVA